MMMSGEAMSRFPFTASQWQELEHQALIYKYIISGIPVPPDLLFSLKRSPTYTLVDSPLSSSSKFLSPHSQHVAWSCFQMGMGKKIDPEPGRCRRTDGKKWRCAKEAYPDSKYCERHMHRGKNRSRKHVELLSSSTPKQPSSLNSTSLSASSNQQTSCYNYFLDPQINSDLRRNRYSYGLKEGVDEHAFFAEPSGTRRSFPAASSMEEPLIMSSSSRQQSSHEDYSYLYLQSDKEKQSQHFYEMPAVVNQEPNKTTHCFFDEEPIRSRDSWDHNKSSTTSLSISMPSSNDFNSARHHDG